MLCFFAHANIETASGGVSSRRLNIRTRFLKGWCTRWLEAACESTATILRSDHGWVPTLESPTAFATYSRWMRQGLP